MKKLMTLILVSMMGYGYTECKAQSNADFEQAEKISISNDYEMNSEVKINPYSNEKFSICTFNSAKSFKNGLVCLYNAEDNTIKILDSLSVRDSYHGINGRDKLYFGIDNDTLYFYDCKTRQYYCSEYPFNKATKYDGNRIPVFNRIKILQEKRLIEYIIHNNQDLIYTDIDASGRVCHYSALTGKTIKLKRLAGKGEGYMFPFSDDEVLLVEGFLVSNHGDFEELPYIYNYQTNKITEIKLKGVSALWSFYHYDKNTGKAIVGYDYRIYEAAITKQGNKYYLSLTKELFDLRNDNKVDLDELCDVSKYKDFYIFKKMNFEDKAYLKIKKWW